MLNNLNQETNLNPRYTFENIVVGSFNELANAAALAISENPGLTYNPLVIYGGTGLGKTHIMQAIGNKIIKESKKKVKYDSSNNVISEMVEELRTSGNIDNLKNQLSSFDVLIVDNIQFLYGKPKTQEEFFNLLDYLYKKNKQMVLSSDRPPRDLPILEEKIRIGFDSGMITDISLPDYETRLLILKARLQQKQIKLPKYILKYMAIETAGKNIRDLEVAVDNLLFCYKRKSCVLRDALRHRLSARQ